MALESPVSYWPTLSEFLIHWESVEVGLGVPLVLREGDLAGGQALLLELEAAALTVVRAGLEVQGARADAAEGRVRVREGLEDFNGTVRSYWAGTPAEEVLPRLPLVGAALDKYLRPCRDGLRIWEGLEGEPSPPGAPVPLRVGPHPGLSRGEYAALVEGERLLGLALEEAEYQLGWQRARRNAVMRRVRALLMSYARTLPTRLKPGDVYLETMPRLWPLPGHTPEAVRAAGEWVAARRVARLTWTVSGDAGLAHYQVRGCAGPEYRKEDEAVVGTISPEGERVLETGGMLGRRGAVACYRVYVVLKTGNERASNVVVVTADGL
ncbi:MAG: hypothetical protein V4584_08790 [Verrucomicrobiota bacterium]